MPDPPNLELTSETLTRYCIHEAGHVVVAAALGMHIRGVVKHEHGLGMAACAPEKPTALEHFTMAAWTMAGSVAERRCESWDPRGSISDFDAACFHLKAWLGEVVKGDELLALVSAAERLACDILTSRWNNVVRVAAVLESNGGTATEGELYAALKNGESSKNTERDEARRLAEAWRDIAVDDGDVMACEAVLPWEPEELTTLLDPVLHDDMFRANSQTIARLKKLAGES